MNQDKTIILACSSLTEYVEAAQARAGTKMQVRYLNRIYHRDPAEMQEHIKAELERMPEEIDTVLVCMGFCGGSWNQVQSRYRLVIPKRPVIFMYGLWILPRNPLRPFLKDW